MKTKTPIAKTTSPTLRPNTLAGRLSSACAGWLLLWLLFWALPTAVRAQFTFILTNDAITITGYTGTNGSVVIPATINGYPVTSMGERAFQWCTSVTNVTIPDGVTNFGDYAFSDIDGDNVFSLCTSLTAINVDAGNPVCSSLAGVLFNQGQTTLLECPEAEAGSYLVPGSVTFIAANAFYHCPNLASVTIPASVICLGNYAFAACGALTNVTLGPNVACIGDQAFAGTSLTSVILDDNVTNIGSGTFMQCANLTSITIPNSVTTIGGGSFWACPSLTSITIPDGVTSIGSWMFTDCHSLTNIVIGNGVTNIGDMAFVGCHSLATMFFTGNAPANPGDNFNANTNLTVYAVLGTTGWGSTFEGMPVEMLPGILWPPQSQTAELGATVDFTPEVPGTPTVTCLWFFNSTNLICSGTNACLELTNVGYSMDGAYTLVVTNVNGAVTSSPAMLNVIPAVAHRPIPVVQMSGATGSMLNVDYVNVLTPTLNWTMLGSVSLTSPSQFYFDTSMPLAPQRFYRVWQPGTPGVVPSVSMPGLIPMVTLTGTVGNHLELDYINQFGPTNAWATLGTITLTNTAQPYFDLSALRQPARLYRITTVP